MNVYLINFVVLIFSTIYNIEVAVNGQQEDYIREAKSVEMMQKPYKILQEHRRLTSLTWEDRGKLCLEKIPQIKEHIFTASDQVLPPHKYKFDDEEELLAIQCHTMPTIYIGLPTYGKIPIERWHIRTMKSSKKYNFTFETFTSVREATEKESFAFVRDATTYKTHIFRRSEMKEYWYLCNEAEKVIRYEPRRRQSSIGKPELYTYSTGTYQETYLTVRCATDPIMHIHAGKFGLGDEFTIVFRKSHAESMKLKSFDE